MSDSIKLTATIPVTPKVVYNAWLNKDEHSAFTKSKAEITKQLHSNFSAFDGYITGRIELLHMNKRIFLTWRTTDFTEDQPDSNVELFFHKVAKGTKIELIHSNLPEGTADKYKKEWKDNYFNLLKAYFGNK
ncbi:MAG: hypothetical protein CR986_10160 [Ignavibacteriae bacterium]|nr:MAG: hypothetical protein CR986_10160 [Ignavibacteriota bacterium]